MICLMGPEWPYFFFHCLAKELARRKNCPLSVSACVAVLSGMANGYAYRYQAVHLCIIWKYGLVVSFYNNFNLGRPPAIWGASLNVAIVPIETCSCPAGSCYVLLLRPSLRNAWNCTCLSHQKAKRDPGTWSDLCIFSLEGHAWNLLPEM